MLLGHNKKIQIPFIANELSLLGSEIELFDGIIDGIIDDVVDGVVDGVNQT